MNIKSSKVKNAKKTAAKKISSAQKTNATAKKAKLKIKKIVAKKPHVVSKRLGKGLKDISHLFFSINDEVSVKPAKKATNSKTKKAVVGKIKKTPVPAEKKPALLKAKKLKTASRKKTVESKAKIKSTTLKKKAVEPTSVKTTKKALARKTTVNKKTKPIETKRIIRKPSKKKTEVIRMPIEKKSGKATESSSKAPRKVNESKQALKSKAGDKKKTQLGSISELSALLKKKKKIESASVVINAKPEPIIEESKFFTGPAVVSEEIKDRQNYELPVSYGDTRIVVQVRDPYWMHSYWEISQDKINLVCRDLGSAINDARRILRVYDITNVIFNGSNANKYFDIDINDYANSWYINPQEAGRSFCVEIGFLLADGRFVMLARSNCVSMPSDGPSTITDEEWMIVEEDFNRLYGMSVGLGIGLSSMELRKQISQRLVNLSSGVLSSPGVQRIKVARKFWLKVHTELIVYGATEPGAKVSVQGKSIDLNKDGTFSLRFALPDGKQVIPVKGVSEDGLEERVITPIVSKKTE